MAHALRRAAKFTAAHETRESFPPFLRWLGTMTVENQHSRLADDPAMPRPGDVLDGRYRIEHVLGEGGFAAVFKATDAKTGKAFAVKVLDPIMSRRDEFRRRFFLEVENSSKLNHIHTIHVSDQGETESGCLYLVMELLEGKSLDELLKERGPMPPHLVHAVAVQTLRSLREAHQLNILHRDIKPANIFIVSADADEDIFVKVVDFGIAKSMDSDNDAALTSTGQVMCSPHYVAPERIVDHQTYPASDIYSLGISMIEMLEGAPPYDGENTIQLVMMHARMENAVPMREETRNSILGPILARATHKDHAKRYQSADEMLAALREVYNAQSNVTPTDPLDVYREEIDQLPLPPAWRRGSYSTIAAILLVFLIVFMVGFFAWRTLGRAQNDDSQQAVTQQQKADNQTSEQKNDEPSPSASGEAAATPGSNTGREALNDSTDDEAALGEAATATYTLESTPEGASVYINDVRVGRTPWNFDPKDARFASPPFQLRLELPDGREVSRRIQDVTTLHTTAFEFSEPAPDRKPVKDDSTTRPTSKPADTRPSRDPDPQPTTQPTTQPSKPTSESPADKPKASDEKPSTRPTTSGTKPSTEKKTSADTKAEEKPDHEKVLEQLRKTNAGGGYGGSKTNSGGYYNR